MIPSEKIISKKSIPAAQERKDAGKLGAKAENPRDAGVPNDSKGTKRKATASEFHDPRKSQAS